jgi:hypothetical protein
MEESMKQGGVISILLFLFGLLVQGAWGADVEMSGNIGITGSVTANSFSGDGSGLTGTADISILGNAATASLATSVGTGTVDTPGLVNGAVTPGKIAFMGRVAIVAKSGGDYSDPATAMSDYTAWCESPSADNPCLLKIMPGVYDVGSSPVEMHAYIDIEGSGENTTKITGAISTGGGFPPPPAAGIVMGADNAEIRFLTVENTGTGFSTSGIVNVGTSPSILNVTVSASGGTGNFGVRNRSFSSSTMTNVNAAASGGNDTYGVYNDNSSPAMTNVNASASGGTTNNYGVLNFASLPTMNNVRATASGGAYSYGIRNEGSSPTMMNVSASASGGTTGNYGVYNQTSVISATVKINNSVIKGSTNTIYNSSGVTTLVGNTQLDGGAVSDSGTLVCAGVYDEDYTFYQSTCP